MSITKYGDRDQRRRIRMAIKAIMTQSLENAAFSSDLVCRKPGSKDGSVKSSSFANRKNTKRLSLKL